MKEVSLTNELLLEFLDNLRLQDKIEFNEVLKTCSLEEFINVCFDDKQLTYFLTTDDGKPLALGGAYRISADVAKIWLLTTNEISNYKFAVYKYVKNKIEQFKKVFAVLYNFIFKSNFSSLIWLRNCQ